jgi:hypothetical protein
MVLLQVKRALQESWKACKAVKADQLLQKQLSSSRKQINPFPSAVLT